MQSDASNNLRLATKYARSATRFSVKPLYMRINTLGSEDGRK